MDSALAGQTAGPLALPFQKTRGPSLKPAVFTLKYKPEVLTLEPPLPSSAPGGSLGARPGSARHSAAQRGRPSGQRRPRSLLQAPCGGRGRAAGPGQGAPSPPRPRRVRGGPPCRPPPAPARLRPPACGRPPARARAARSRPPCAPRAPAALRSPASAPLLVRPLPPAAAGGMRTGRHRTRAESAISGACHTAVRPHATGGHAGPGRGKNAPAVGARRILDKPAAQALAAERVACAPGAALSALARPCPILILPSPYTCASGAALSALVRQPNGTRAALSTLCAPSRRLFKRPRQSARHQTRLSAPLSARAMPGEAGL